MAKLNPDFQKEAKKIIEDCKALLEKYPVNSKNEMGWYVIESAYQTAANKVDSKLTSYLKRTMRKNGKV